MKSVKELAITEFEYAISLTEAHLQELKASLERIKNIPETSSHDCPQGEHWNGSACEPNV